jgi:hypothetical protein
MQYPVIAQPQYGFGPTMPMMPSMSDMPPAMMPTMNFKEGGIASLSLPEMAEKVESAGRNGDTMLAHITPEEAGILQLLGGSGTINPRTGQPEYFKKFFKAVAKPFQSAAKSIAKAVAPIIKPIAPILPFLPIPGLGPMSALLTKSLLTGIASGLDKEGKFNLSRGLKAGALTYGIGSLMQGAQAAQGAPNAAGTGGPYDISDVGSMGDLGYSAPTPSVTQAVGGYDFGAGDIGYVPPSASVAAPPAAPVFNPAIDDLVVPGSSTGSPTSMITPQAPIVQSATPVPGAGAGTPDPTALEGIGSLAEAVGERALSAITPTSAMDALKMASTGATAYGSIKSLQELEKQKEEAERLLRDQENARAEDIAWAQGVLRDYPINYQRLSAEDVKKQMGMAAGGLAGLNAFKAGGQPRFLAGGGDGMSDDIPATIGGRQKAALSDGEFVIPADVVSHLGNGSSRAGAKKLYSMMDNIREARTGKERQAPQVNADRYMPA